MVLSIYDTVRYQRVWTQRRETRQRPQKSKNTSYGESQTAPIKIPTGRTHYIKILFENLNLKYNSIPQLFKYKDSTGLPTD